ncbi:MAG: choice-of-anchor D domain-containing protein, partial [Candidatus Electrothrix sp. GM3_4]|nr:choice-of-anchor D domain-containing protein [Candidatus Electrothrix sp. GM3_4]
GGGGGQFRPLFVKSGTVTIQNLDLENGKAKGGDSNDGGGGAGLGGALFVYSGRVTVENVAFSNNNASGGSAKISSLGFGGGGMFGNSGHGGGALFGDSTNNNGGYGGNGNYGGSGGDSTYYGKNGTFGGGGDSTYYGKNGTFGGGGGYGGAIFAMNGTVTLINVSFSGNTVTPGTGRSNGSANAADVFICTSNLHSTAALCGATVNACGTTSTTEIVGTLGSNCSGTPAPEMDITGNGVSITDNDITPNTTTDHTDFGSTPTGSSVTRTYTIANTGDADLNLTGSGDLVVLVGAGCTEFTVTAQPTSPVSSGGGTTTFTVQYSPTDFSEDTCTITIDNDDSDENPYNFFIKGTGRRGNGWLPATYMLLL